MTMCVFKVAILAVVAGIVVQQVSSEKFNDYSYGRKEEKPCYGMETMQFIYKVMKAVYDYSESEEQLQMEEMLSSSYAGTEKKSCYGMETMEFINEIMRAVYKYQSREKEVDKGRRYLPSNREEEVDKGRKYDPYNRELQVSFGRGYGPNGEVEVNMEKSQGPSEAKQLWEKIMKKRI